MNPNRTVPILEASLAVIAWGISFVATKVALRYLSPITVVWMRFGLGVVILGTAVFLRRQFAVLNRGDILYMAGLGFIGIAFHQWLQSTALLTTQATNTSWIVATTPIFMALLGVIALQEPLSALQVTGMFSALLGVLLVVSHGDLRSLSLANFGAPGDFLALVSALNWAVFSALSRSGLRRHPATRMMFYVMLFGWLQVSMLFLLGGSASEISSLPPDGWAAVIFLGVACSGLAYIFWYDALQKLPIAQTAAFIYFEPLITVIVAAWVLGEAFLPASAVGGAAILFGVWLVNRRS